MAARTIQGTLINDYADRQREIFSTAGETSGGNNKLGAHTPSGVFSFYNPKDVTKTEVTAEDLMENTTSAFHSPYVNGVGADQNPDFGEVAASAFKYETSYFDKVKKQGDKPGIFGPNLSVPDVHNPNAESELTSDYEEGNVSSPTSLLQNSAEIPESFDTKGFGIGTKRNDPRSQSGIQGPFNVNSRNVNDTDTPQKATLGEYINTAGEGEDLSGYLDHTEYNYES